MGDPYYPAHEADDQIERWRTLSADIASYHQRFGDSRADTPSEVHLAHAVTRLLSDLKDMRNLFRAARATSHEMELQRDEALEKLDEREVQALKGDLLDELGRRGWMLMDLSRSTIIRALAGDPRKSSDDGVRPNWRVRRENGYYSYGDTPDMAILAGLSDESNERTPKAAP